MTIRAVLTSSVMLVAGATATALAQPVPGGAPMGDMAMTLDPGATGTQIPPSSRPTAPAQPAQQQPNVVIVGPDGTVKNQPAAGRSRAATTSTPAARPIRPSSTTARRPSSTS